MLYFRCPTCKTILANKQLEYEEKLDKICKNTSLSKDEINKQKMELFDELQIIRYCCRMRFLGYIKYIDIIK